MSMSPKPANAPTSLKGGGASAPADSKSFMMMVLDMGWQLAIAIIVPMLLGVYLGKVTHAKTPFVLAGFAVAMVLAGLVIKRFYHMANNIPVPKMTAADKARFKKMNQEDEDD